MTEARFYHLPSGTTREQAVQRLARGVEGLPADRAWTIEVREHKGTRSQAQNAYLWGVVYATILREGGEQLRGWTADDLHEFFLGEVFGWTRLDGMNRPRVKPVRRSSRLNKTEFADFLDHIIRWAAGVGIVIPDAGGSLDNWQG